MTEIDKKNLKKYLYCTFGITYISWGILAIFTQSHILGLETIIGRILHIVGALGPAKMCIRDSMYGGQGLLVDFDAYKKKLYQMGLR